MEPAGTGAYPNGFVSGIARYFSDLAHDSGGNQNVDSVGPQYNDLTGALANYDVRFGGVLVDTDPYPATQCPADGPVTDCLTDPQIQQEIESFVTAHHLPTDLSHEYFLLTPPHVESCFSSDPTTSFDGCSAGMCRSTIAAYCAYHGNTATSTMVIYANMPFDADNPLLPGLQQSERLDLRRRDQRRPEPRAHRVGHRPDPQRRVDHRRRRPPRLRDRRRLRGYMGTPLGTAPNGSPYNQVINGHLYWYQRSGATTRTAACSV